MYRTSAAALALLILAACTSQTAVAPTAVRPSPTSSPLPSTTPTPTPVQYMLLIAEASPDWEDKAATFAQGNGWSLQRVDPVNAVQHLREPNGPVAIISLGAALVGELEAAAGQGIPVLIVNAPGVEPQALLSTVVDVRFDQAGFLAGVMVGLSSSTGWVGLVTGTGGPNEAEYSAGFTQGILWGCPRCQVIGQAADEMSIDRFRANTVDAIFPIPGSSAELVAGSLADAGFPLVWVGAEGPAGEALIGRIVYDEGLTVLSALNDLLETGEGRNWTLSIENRAINPVDIGEDRLSPGRQRLLEDAYEAIVAGELDIGTQLDG